MKKIFLILSFLSSQIFSQYMSDSLSWMNFNNPANKVSSNFYKQFTTYNLNSLLITSQQFDNFRIHLNENFLSTVIKTNSYRNIKDENFLSASGDYRLINELSFGLTVNSKSYLGDRTISLSDSKNSNLLLYSIYNPQPNIRIMPFAGYSQNSLVGLNDNGYLYGSEATANKLNLQNFILSGNAKFKNEDIMPRKNYDRILILNLENAFENNLRNILSANIFEIRKDLYFDTDSITLQQFDIQKNIQSRIEKKSIFGDKLEYKPHNSPFGFLFEGNISNRLIDRKTRYLIAENMKQSDFDYKIDELKIDLTTSLNYSSDKIDGFIRINYSEKEEKYRAKFFSGANITAFKKRQAAESQKNNKSQLTNLAISANYKLSSSDLISASIFHRKLVYNTQSDLNFDDRDELLSVAQFKYERLMNYLWNMQIGLEGNLNRIVYIFSERSSNNNITRVIKLFSAVNYSGYKFKSSNYAEVTANYTVYDFEDLNPNYKSFSFRQFMFRDSSTAKISAKIFLNFFGYIKLSEQEELNWSKFRSRPFRTIKEEYAEPKIEFRNSGISFSSGIRFYTLTNYKFIKNFKRDIANYYSSIGPIAEVNINIGQLNVRTSGYYEFISSNGSQVKELANLYLVINWNF